MKMMGLMGGCLSLSRMERSKKPRMEAHDTGNP